MVPCLGLRNPVLLHGQTASNDCFLLSSQFKKPLYHRLKKGKDKYDLKAIFIFKIVHMFLHAVKNYDSPKIFLWQTGTFWPFVVI